MGAFRWGWLVLAWLALNATAGDIYVCKGAHGVNSYQTLPCANSAHQLRKTEYSDTMARATTPAPAQYGASMPVARLQANAYVPLPRAKTPPPIVGYECIAGARKWIGTESCPSTYVVFEDGDGTTDSGEMVDVTMTRHLPVRQVGLDQDEFCSRIGAGERIGQGGDDVDQSYEHNKLMRNVCGG